MVTDRIDEDFKIRIGEDCEMAGMAEVKVSVGDKKIWAVLGSCVALVLHDDKNKVGGVAHIMLPKSDGYKSVIIGKYADTAVPELLRKMIASGADKPSIRAKIVGGAVLFDSWNNYSALRIGPKIEKAIKKILESEDIRITASDIGGERGRKIRFDISTGKVMVEVFDVEIKEI